MVLSFLGQLEKYIKKIERLNQVDALRFLQAQRTYDIIFRRRVALATTGCVICLGTEFQMGVAQKWLKPCPQKFSQLFAMVFGSFFEIL